MRDRLIFTSQFIFTLLVAAFLVVPAILSISAGVTVNYFRGIQSGVTLQWVAQVWEMVIPRFALCKQLGNPRVIWRGEGEGRKLKTIGMKKSEIT